MTNYAEMFKYLLVSKTVFSAKKAVGLGTCIDTKGKKHQIIASTSCYIITLCDGVERCFDHDGKQLATFPDTRLVEPACVRNSYPHYWFYNPETMELLWMCNNYRSPTKTPMFKEHPNMGWINSTNGIHREMIAAWGFDKISWLSD